MKTYIYSILIFIFINCSNDKLKKNDEMNDLFSQNKYEENEKYRLTYLNNYFLNNTYDSYDAYNLYQDSINTYINQLELKQVKNKSDLTYSIDSLKKSRDYFYQYINSFIYSEFDKKQGTQFYYYKQDIITYETISFYLKLRYFTNSSLAQKDVDN